MSSKRINKTVAFSSDEDIVLLGRVEAAIAKGRYSSFSEACKESLATLDLPIEPKKGLESDPPEGDGDGEEEPAERPSTIQPVGNVGSPGDLGHIQEEQDPAWDKLRRQLDQQVQAIEQKLTSRFDRFATEIRVELGLGQQTPITTARRSAEPAPALPEEATIVLRPDAAGLELSKKLGPLIRRF